MMAAAGGWHVYECRN